MTGSNTDNAWVLPYMLILFLYVVAPVLEEDGKDQLD
jgi:hypothetical protein